MHTCTSSNALPGPVVMGSNRAPWDCPQMVGTSSPFCALKGLMTAVEQSGQAAVEAGADVGLAPPAGQVDCVAWLWAAWWPLLEEVPAWTVGLAARAAWGSLLGVRGWLALGRGLGAGVARLETACGAMVVEGPS